MAQSKITLKLRESISSAKLSRSDIQRLSSKLEERISAAADLEVENLGRPANTDDEAFEQLKQNMRDAFRLSVTIKGADNQELFGTTSEVFENPNFPENVVSFYANSATTLRGSFNYVPRNEVEVFVDFGPVASFDFNTSPGEATLNNSEFVVTGVDATWCNGLFHEISQFFGTKENYLPVIHKGDFWNFLFWLFGIPLCFWVTFRASSIVSAIFSTVSEFVVAAAYLYIFLMFAHVLRALFWYARWIWPKIEYEGGRSTIAVHRIAVVSLALALLGSLIYDILSVLF